MSTGTMAPEVKVLDAGDAAARERWDALVSAGAPGATFCHYTGWLDVIGGVLGHRPHYLMAEADGAPTAVLPLFEVRSRLFGSYLLSMPFLNYGGAAGDEEAGAVLTRRAVELAGEREVDLLELRTLREVADLDTSNRKITLILELPDSADVLWNDVFRSKLRGKIKRPMKEGIETRFGADELDAFYHVFSRNMRDLGTPVLPKAFFAAILAHVPGAIMGAAYHEGAPIAAGLGFLHREEFEMTWSSSLRESNTMKPNMLLYWDFMQRVIGAGGRAFNFGRSTPGSSTHDFKRGWGAVEVPLPWAQWSASGVAATPSPDRPLFRLATAAWSRLPMPIANRIGPLLSPKLP